MNKTIAGVTILITHPDLQFKSLEELKKKEQVFSHLSNTERESAQNELWEHVKPEEKKRKEKNV